jgi:hypothetical protein
LFAFTGVDIALYRREHKRTKTVTLIKPVITPEQAAATAEAETASAATAPPAGDAESSATGKEKKPTKSAKTPKATTKSATAKNSTSSIATASTDATTDSQPTTARTGTAETADGKRPTATATSSTAAVGGANLKRKSGKGTKSTVDDTPEVPPPQYDVTIVPTHSDTLLGVYHLDVSAGLSVHARPTTSLGFDSTITLTTKYALNMSPNVVAVRGAGAGDDTNNASQMYEYDPAHERRIVQPQLSGTRNHTIAGAVPISPLPLGLTSAAAVSAAFAAPLRLFVVSDVNHSLPFTLPPPPPPLVDPKEKKRSAATTTAGAGKPPLALVHHTAAAPADTK